MGGLDALSQLEVGVKAELRFLALPKSSVRARRRLKICVERELRFYAKHKSLVDALGRLKVGIKAKLHLLPIPAYSSLRIRTHALLKEVLFGL